MLGFDRFQLDGHRRAGRNVDTWEQWRCTAHNLANNNGSCCDDCLWTYKWIRITVNSHDMLIWGYQDVIWYLILWQQSPIVLITFWYSVLIPIRSLKQTGKHQTLSHYRNHPNNQCVWIDRLVAHIDITKWPGADLLRHLSNPRRSEWGFSRKGWQKNTGGSRMLALSKYWSARTLIALRIIEAYQRTFSCKLRREVTSINGFPFTAKRSNKSTYMVTFRPTHLWDDWINTRVSVYTYANGASISTV